ncbi:hypothetical protein [uncultured Algoriphagus sp.]|uniref:hypothetical protein n=1 Tax=uncultured Algoriphagus sp. TaxID=417365 RepID=UPI0030EC8361|tara:strand:- start:25 stop:210 length:186 start_codon:yes stop_codon:yes gene_type:complete
MEAWLVFDDRKVWTDTAEVKNKASGQPTRKAALCPFLTSSNQSKKQAINSKKPKQRKNARK